MNITRLDADGKRIPPGSDKKVARYQVRWRDATGRQRAKSFTRWIDAKNYLRQLGADEINGISIDPDAGRETVGRFARRWADGQPWRESSRDRMNHIIDSQIVPKFGNTALRSVRPSDVQSWVGQMTASGLAPSTVESYFRCFASIMRAAVRDDLVRRSPCDKISLPQREDNHASIVPLTSEEVHSLAGAVSDRYRALVLVSAGLGLRQGEACGLTVDRVHFLKREVVIDRQLISPAKGPVRFGPPKTRSSRRTIALPDSVGEVLASHIDTYPPGDDGLIFTSRTGAALRRSTWNSVFSSAAKVVGLNASSHDLRHHCASLLISSGCSVKAVQRFLGHKNASETLDTYGHLWPGDDDRIRTAIDAGLLRDVHETCTDAAGQLA